MSAPPPAPRRAAFAFAWLALFSVLYTAGESLGLWPQMWSGAFRDLDLAAGAVGVAAIGGWLAFLPSSR